MSDRSNKTPSLVSGALCVTGRRADEQCIRSVSAQPRPRPGSAALASSTLTWSPRRQTVLGAQGPFHSRTD